MSIADSTTIARHVDAKEVKRLAAGKWPEILSQVGGINRELLDGKHHPCPKCEGTDRFRMLDPNAGAMYCNKCFSEKNGDGFASHDKTAESGQDIETEFCLDQFPTPEELWARYKAFRNIEDEDAPLVEQPYHQESGGKEPRYYQVEAINRTVEAIAKNQKRVLLVMATGTGKTYTAFQIIWRLWKAGEVKRILFLADRNILVDQTLVNDFKPFGAVMTKVKNRKVDPAYEIHLALYQALTGPDEADKTFKSVSRDFFDLIVVDECHRGSAAEDSVWREILQYFNGAVQIGMTATPRETE